jgi:hypothetical protein
MNGFLACLATSRQTAGTIGDSQKSSIAGFIDSGGWKSASVFVLFAQLPRVGIASTLDHLLPSFKKCRLAGFEQDFIVAYNF